MSRSVCVYRYCPKDSSHIPWAIEANAVWLAAEAVKGELITDQSKGLDGTTWHTSQSWSLIDVHQQHGGFLLIGLDNVGQ
jgi:hypothetical protein